MKSGGGNVIVTARMQDYTAIAVASFSLFRGLHSYLLIFMAKRCHKIPQKAVEFTPKSRFTVYFQRKAIKQQKIRINNVIKNTFLLLFHVIFFSICVYFSIPASVSAPQVPTVCNGREIVDSTTSSLWQSSVQRLSLSPWLLAKPTQPSFPPTTHTHTYTHTYILVFFFICWDFYNYA